MAPTPTSLPHQENSAGKHQSLSNTLNQTPLGYYSSRRTLKQLHLHSPPPRTEEIPQLWCDVKRDLHAPALSFVLSPASSQTGFPGPLSSSPLPLASSSLPPPLPAPFYTLKPDRLKMRFFHLPFPTSWKSVEKEPTQIKEFQVCAPPPPLAPFTKQITNGWRLQERP